MSVNKIIKVCVDNYGLIGTWFAASGLGVGTYQCYIDFPGEFKNSFISNAPVILGASAAFGALWPLSVGYAAYSYTSDLVKWVSK